MTVENDISEAIDRFGTVALPDAAVQAAKRAVLDWLACALAGNATAAGQAVQEFAQTEAGTGPSTCLLPGLPGTSPRLAALVNGVLSHALELDDIYAPALYHPGVCVVPAALATAQHSGADGLGFLRAVVAGYEIANRIGTAINPAHYTYWHTTGTVGAIGAAVAAAVAQRLTRDQSGWAVGNAATMAAGLKQAFRSDGMTKPLHAGRAAESGVLAVLLAQSGFTGASEMLTGPAGLAAAMGKGADLTGCLDDVFDDYTITRATVKRFAACGHTFAAIDAALDLNARLAEGAHAQIGQVTIRTYSAAIEAAGHPAPETVFEARFSIAFCAAAALCGHDLSRVSALADAMRDDNVKAVCQRVSVVADPAFDARFPALRGASVALKARDGASLDACVETRKGAPENPLSDDELAHKVMALLGESPFPAAAHDWVRWCNTLDKATDLGRASLPSVATPANARAE
jgi:2-methylcitrate dehydratase PrpD